jgi:hypothetical protein
MAKLAVPAMLARFAVLAIVVALVGLAVLFKYPEGQKSNQARDIQRYRQVGLRKK